MGTLEVKTRWIPTTMLRTMYINRFYIRFSEALDSVASVKLLNEAKSPLKFYKITFDRKKISIFENHRNTNFLLGLNERRLRSTQMIDFKSMTDHIGYAGF